MSLLLETPPKNFSHYPDRFGVTQPEDASRQPMVNRYSPYGRYALGRTMLLDTPPDVQRRREVLTNPSQIEQELIRINGVPTAVLFAYFRQEPTSLHLGKTNAVPYLLRRNRQGELYLSEFYEAMPLVGEDPRVVREFKIAGLLGKIHSGWCISTVVATAKPGNPADVESIKQVFNWGEKLSKLEPILEIKDLKNTNPFPIARIRDPSETGYYDFGRPHPHITFTKVAKMSEITEERIESGKNITKNFLPAGFHAGVNNVNVHPKNPNFLILDAHEATAHIRKNGKELHYRLVRYLFDIDQEKIIRRREVASRADFPYAEPKPPENGVGSYDDILYGSMGDPRIGLMLTGVSDRHIGLAEIIQRA